MDSVITYSIYGFLIVSCSYLGEKGKSKALITLSLFIIIVFWGFRKDIGWDYEGYVEIFKNAQYNYNWNIELGYYYLNILFTSFKEGYIYVLLCATIITYLFLFKAFRQYKIIWLGVFFSLVYQFQFMAANQVRQSIAISIFLYSLYFLINKKYLIFCLIITLTSIFVHLSAITLFFAIPFSKINLSRRVWSIIIVLTYTLYIVGYFKFLGNYIFSIIPLPEQYARYLLGSRVNPEEVGFSIVQLCNVCISLYIIWNYKNHKNSILLPIYLIGILMYMIFIEYHLFLRASFYFTYVNIILASLVYKQSPKRGLPLMIFSGLLFILICSRETNMHGIIPYQSLLF